MTKKLDYKVSMSYQGHDYLITDIWLFYQPHDVEYPTIQLPKGLNWVDGEPFYCMSAAFGEPHRYTIGTKLYRFSTLKKYGIEMTFHGDDESFKKAWENLPDNTPRSSGGGLVIAIEDDF